MSTPWHTYNRKNPPVSKSPPGAGRWGYDAWMLVCKVLPGFAQDIAYLAGKTRDLGVAEDQLGLRPHKEHGENVRQAAMTVVVEAIEERLKELDDHPTEQEVMGQLLVEARRRKERPIKWWE